MAMRFKPLTVGGAALRRFAQRLADQLAQTGLGSASRVVDGYLLRAVKAGKDVVVYVIDPVATWAFLHHGTISGAGTALLFAARAYNRGVLTPGVPPVVAEPVTVGAGTALLPWQPGAGYASTIYGDALLSVANYPSVAIVTPGTVATAILAAKTGASEPTFAGDKYQLWVDVMHAEQGKWYAAGADTSEFVGKRSRLLDWFFPEAALASITGDSAARLYRRKPSRFNYVIPVFGGQSATEALASPAASSLWYADPLCGGAYASQPTGADTAPPISDPAYQGIAGTFISRWRRPDVPASNFYPLTHIRSTSRLLTVNPEPELVPALIDGGGTSPTAYAAHGVVGTALYYELSAEDAALPASGTGARGTAHLFSYVYCLQGGTYWKALQLQSMPPSGAISAATLYKSTDNIGFVLGQALRLFGVNGVYATSVPAAGTLGTGVDFLHLGVDGVLRTTNLRASGWYAFCPYTAATGGFSTGSLWGQAPVYCADLGDNKVAVIARDYVVPGAATAVTWSLVVLAADTGEFIESRGPVGSAPTFTYLAYLSVITPERTVDEVTTPAVLTCTLGGNHRVSTDGGRTWVILFTGFVGRPLYLGNQLKRLRFGESL